MSVTDLMRAARYGDLKGVKRNLNQVGRKDGYGWTALMWAVRGGHANCIPLLEKEIGMQSNDGWTALMLAASNGNTDSVRLLLSEVGKQTTTNITITLNGKTVTFPPGTTALMMAARNGHTDCILLLKEEVGKQNKDGMTALMWAAIQGHANCIPLLEKEIGMQHNWGWTALMRAAFNGQADCVRLLLSEAGKQTTKEYKITLNGNTFTFPPGATALMLATYFNHSEIVELLLPYERGMKDSKGHTAQWHANNSPREDDFTQVRKLLENEGTSRLPPPPSPELIRCQGSTSSPIEHELLKKELSQSKDEVSSLKNQLAEMQSTILKQDNKIFQLRTENTSLQEQLASSKNTQEGTGGNVSQMNQEINLLKQKLQKANEEAKKNHELNEALNRRVQEAEKSLAEARGEITSLKNQLTEMESTILKQDNKISHLRTENTSLQEQLSSSKKAQGEAEERLSQMNQEISSFKAQLSKTSEEKDALHKQFEDRERRDKAQIDQLTAEVSSLKQQLDNAIDESKRHAEMNEDLRKASDQNRALINSLTTEKGTLQEQLSKTNESFKRALADQKAQNLALEKEVAQLRTESHDMKDLRRRLEEVEEEKRILLQNLAAVGGRLPPAREDSSLISSAIQGDLNTLRRHLDQAGQKDSSGMTALMHAASRGQTEVVRLLRPLEARLQDGRGWTALMHAVGGGHEECVGLLLLERDLKDREGRTAEDVANGLPDGKKKITPLLRKKVHLPDLPDELSSFQLTGRLGRGTFGTVFSAWSEEHGNCALKVVEYEEMERTIVDSLRREMGTIPSLEHPHVLRYHRVHDDPDNGTAYLVMDWCSGTLLDEVRGRGERGEPFRDEEVWRCLREMASGLAYLHEKRHVHRDLKPENVLLSSDGRCVLGDFGLARTLGDSSRMSTLVGTFGYMAPEIHQGENYDKSVDVWALGVMGYELCTHALPFENVAAVLNETSAPSLEGRPSELAALISRMLSKDPKDRPTAQEVLAKAS
ncbi:Kinase, NEK [Giardia muris]|uniref:Kinase, NEK n=1 Tax=Giardia muris TaxID=5742 RepID=A0A4Z1SNH0_GIAMU|nr:Kinase, NEK [Giardia muris]|eukprot:TNJ27322.1 Kinase, NEK [Giardia muris]